MKSKIKKSIKYLAFFTVAGIIGLLVYVSFALPDVGEPEELSVELTPERIERGKYLANSVMVCMECHSELDYSRFANPLVEGTLGKGGQVFDENEGLPGKFYAKNITPYNLKNWTDGELLRAITTGVNKDGKALFPIMPHPNYGKLDREDLYSIIAYIRTLDPIESSVPESEADFPMNFIINTIPAKAQFSKIPARSNPVEYGAYLVNAASCGDCHTKREKGEFLPGMELAGGNEFIMKTGGMARSANITPDKETGIGHWTEEMFLGRFKAYADSSFKSQPVKQGSFNTPMPWLMYSRMETDDLRAIYAYLRTIKPVKNKVVKFSSELSPE